MAKLGRNEPCPCGSGKKYKRCCLERDEAAAAEQAAAAAARKTADLAAVLGALGGQWEDDGLDDASNGVVDLIHQGKLDEAEAAAHDLLRRYPDVIDGLERLAMVYEARGDRARAFEYYHRAADFIRDDPDGFEPQAEVWMRQTADKFAPET
jgi:tetratricopeptide (TPR) repeat protein